MNPVAGHLVGPARLRWRLRAALQDAGIAYQDTLGTGAIGSALDDVPRPANGATNWPGALLALRQAGYRGLVQGLGDTARLQLVGDLARALAQTALVAVADSAVEYRWQQAARAAGLAGVVTAARITSLAADMHWLGARHDLLVIDTPEQMPHGALAQACDASAALARVGLIQRIDSQSASRWASGIGALLASVERGPTASHSELRMPLPAALRASYEAAWHTFLAAFDRFATARPDAGFGTFVQQARSDPTQRPALRAWHEAVRLVAWHEHKAAMVAELLQRHRAQRTLVFTPDRRAAYELASRHLIPAITAEVPRAERQVMLDAFHQGSLPALAGPRLLDLGIAEGTADVAILVGGGYGRDQRDARVRRVRRDGMVYELTTLDSLEVSRAQRWRTRDAAASGAVHDR